MIPYETLALAKDHQEELRGETSDEGNQVLTGPVPIVSPRLRHRMAGALRGLAERLEPSM